MSWRTSTPPLLVEIADQVSATLAEALSLGREDAEYAGYLVMRRLAEHLGGSQVYVPKLDRIARHERDVAIWRAFDGQNHAALARAHGVSVIHLYRIVARMRREAQAEGQAELFGAPSPAAGARRPDGKPNRDS